MPSKTLSTLCCQIRLISLLSLLATVASCGDDHKAQYTSASNGNGTQDVKLSYKNSASVAKAVLFASKQTHATFENLPGTFEDFSSKPGKTKIIGAYGTASSMAKQATCPIGGTFEIRDSGAGTSGDSPAHEPMRLLVYFNCGYINSGDAVQYVDGDFIINHKYVSDPPQDSTQDWSEKYEIKNNISIQSSNDTVENYGSTQLYYIYHDASTNNITYKFEYFTYSAPNGKLINWGTINDFVDKTSGTNNDVFSINGMAYYQSVGFIHVSTIDDFVTSSDGHFLAGKMLITGNHNSKVRITVSSEGDLIIEADEQNDNLYESSSIIYHNTVFNSY